MSSHGGDYVRSVLQGHDGYVMVCRSYLWEAALLPKCGTHRDPHSDWALRRLTTRLGCRSVAVYCFSASFDKGQVLQIRIPRMPKDDVRNFSQQGYG